MKKSKQQIIAEALDTRPGRRMLAKNMLVPVAGKAVLEHHACEQCAKYEPCLKGSMPVVIDGFTAMRPLDEACWVQRGLMVVWDEEELKAQRGGREG